MPYLQTGILLLALISSALAFNQDVARAQWRPTNGPYGGEILALAVNGDIMYAGTRSGVFVSRDDGANWTTTQLLIPTGVPTNRSIVAIAPMGTMIFAGTIEGNLFRSIDSGSTWTFQGRVARFQLYALQAMGTKLFVGSNDDQLVSNDSGASWQADTNGLGNITLNCFAVNGSTLFGGSGGSGIFRSIDSGATWAPINTGSTDINAHVTNALAVAGNKLYAATGSGIFVSSDNGSSWRGVSKMWAYSLAIFGTELFASVPTAYQSNDSGLTWKLASSAMEHSVYAFAVKGTKLFAGTYNNGVVLSEDSGKSWSERNNGLTHIFVSSLAQSEGNIFAGTEAGASLSTNNGITWLSENSGLPPNDGLHTITAVGAKLFATDFHQDVFESTDNGTTWTLDRNVGAISITKIGTDLFAGRSDGAVFVSNDSGASWVKKNNNMLGAGINAFANVGTDIFAGAGTNSFVDLKPDVRGSIYRSSDNGLNWTEVNSGLPHPCVVNALIANGGNLIAGSDEGIFLSTNNGKNWILTLAEGSSAFAIKGKNLFANAISGVYISTDNGKNWSADSSLRKEVGSLLTIGPDLFAATYLEGVWRRPLSDYGVSDVADQSVNNHELQAYPNPFPRLTRISFTPTASGQAQINIVNMLGEEVARIFTGELTAGEHTFTWRSTPAVADGMYECLVRMNGQVERLPLVLAR